jgi:pimeloyl-ACP methyl ester carboxylesterase
MKTILYIHGAFATPGSFTRIKEKLPNHEAILLEYNVGDDIEKIIVDCVKLLKENGKRVSIVAHSLGGVLAARIAQKSTLVDKAITMSTPFGGSKAADMMKWFNPHPMFETISSTSSLLRRLYQSDAGCPTRSLVTVKGENPMINEDNDGVVSVKSQTAWNAPEYISVPYNHFEVLLADETITIIKEFLFDERLDNDDRSCGLREEHLDEEIPRKH